MTSPHSSKSSPLSRSGQAPSPAGQGSSLQQGTTLPPTPVSPFFGNYPNAPHLRPIALPDMTPVLPVQRGLAPTPAAVGGVARTATPGPASTTPGSHSRGSSLPSPYNVSGSLLFGIPSPTSPTYRNQPTVHPLLQLDNGSCPLYYNVLFQPNLRNPHALCHKNVQLYDRDLHHTAINSPLNPISVSVAAYPNPLTGPIPFPWVVTLTSPRRSSMPAHGQTSVITVYDALASLWASLNKPVVEELGRFRPDQLAAATAQRAQRLATGAVPNADPSTFVRSDFLYGCIFFAGISRNPDNSLTVTLVPRSN